MTDDALLADADLAEIARLRADLTSRDQHIAQQGRALEAERAARRQIERAIRAWADDSNHPAMDCAECEALYDIARGTYTDPLLAELAQLRAALAPFAAWAALALDHASERDSPLRDEDIVFKLDDLAIRVGDLRRAVVPPRTDALLAELDAARAVVAMVRWAAAQHYAPPPLCDALLAYDEAMRKPTDET
jgi:hypothetical protein